MSDDPVVIIDNGSGLIKAGFSTDDMPRCRIPSIVGYPRYAASPIAKDNVCEVYVGDKAQKFRGILTIKYPIEHGMITNWDDMEKIWRYVYASGLRIAPCSRPVVLTEVPHNPIHNRVKMAEVFFEKFEVPSFYLGIQGVLALFSNGATTGLILDIGDGVAHTMPIYEGYCYPRAVDRINLAGRDLTEYLMRILREESISLSSSAEKEIVRDMKEKLCYVALNFEEELKKSASSSVLSKAYELPDGQVIKLNDVRFRCPEVLFQPSLIGREEIGIHEMIRKSIHSCPVDIRRSLYKGIVLTGGSTMFTGIDDRLKKELMALVPSTTVININDSSDRSSMVFRGAGILSQICLFNQMCVSKEEYDEVGAEVSLRRFR